jgi:hypothetical protein
MPKGSKPTDTMMSRYRAAQAQFARKYGDLNETVSNKEIEEEYNIGPMAAKAVRKAINTRKKIGLERAKKEPEYQKLQSLMSRYANAVDKAQTP